MMWIETRTDCVECVKASLVSFSSMSVFICVLCREMDHVNTSSSCTFLSVVTFTRILDVIFNKMYIHCTYCNTKTCCKDDFTQV